MRVALIYPDYYHSGCIEGEPQGRVHLGSGYLSAVLKREGHDVSFFHLLEPVDREAFLEWLTAQGAGLVAFSTTSLMFPKVRRMARWAKDETGLPVVAGGVHPTLDPLGTLEEESIDFVCVGEGEATIVELAEALEGRGEVDAIPSLMGRWRGKDFANPVRHLLEDLDSLPFPDRSIFDMARLAPDQRERITVMASRGCPYRCRYCSNHAQRSVYPDGDRYVRFRSVDNVLAEIEELAADAEGVDHVRFDDDILTLRPAWFQEFVREYPRRVDLPFICNSRVNVLDEEMVRSFADAGCSVICMGIESGNEEMRRKVLGRHMSNEEIVKAFRLCREHGIKTVSTNMTNLPDEDLPALLDTVKINAKARPHCLQVSTYHPYPNTRLYAYCKERGYLSGRHVDTIFDGRSALDVPAFAEPAFAFVKEKFYPLAELYSRLFERGLPGEAAARALDAVLTARRVPWRWRLPLLRRVVDWADRRSRFEWIYY